MFVEQQVELVERRSGDLPVMFLVEVIERDGIGEHAVQHLGVPEANVGVQSNGKSPYRAEGLHLAPMLMQLWLALHAPVQRAMCGLLVCRSRHRLLLRTSRCRVPDAQRSCASIPL